MNLKADKKIKVIGVGVGKPSISPEVQDICRDADILVGGERILSFFDWQGKDCFIIKGGNISQIISGIERGLKDGKEVVVLSDGDPLFFGIAPMILDRFGKENVTIIPNISVLQVAAARLGVHWNEVRTVSLHGRDDLFSLMAGLMNFDRIMVYTDHQFNPGRIAKELIKKGIHDHFSMVILEDLGLDTERIRRLDPSMVLEEEFSPLNVVFIERKRAPEVQLTLGIEDEDYIHKKGMITKKEVRAVSLSKLSLNHGNILWDIGAGCGSVGIEAAAIIREGKIFCIEEQEDSFYMIKENIKKTGAYIVEPILGKAPECLRGLPLPDRIFVGGGISKDGNILEEVSDILKKDGIIVLNVVLFESLKKAIDFFRKKGWSHEVTQVLVSRSSKISDDIILRPLSPVFIVSAKKETL